MFKFSQVTTRGSVSDTVLYVELEATSDWDDSAVDFDTCGNDCSDGTPAQNGCDDSVGMEVSEYASCKHKVHIHNHQIDVNSSEGKHGETDTEVARLSWRFEEREEPGRHGTLDEMCSELQSVSCDVSPLCDKSSQPVTC